MLFPPAGGQGRGGDLYAAVFSQHAGGLHRHRPQRHDAGAQAAAGRGRCPVGRAAVYPSAAAEKIRFHKTSKSTLKIWQSDGENALTGIPGRVKISTMCHAEGYRSDEKIIRSFGKEGNSMYRIVRKEALRPTVTLYEIEAPLVAKKAQPGQFIILRVDEKGERIPITINNYDPEKGTVTIIVQTVGATTEKLSHINEGDCLQDFVGPGQGHRDRGQEEGLRGGRRRRLRHCVPGPEEVP